MNSLNIYPYIKHLLRVFATTTGIYLLFRITFNIFNYKSLTPFEFSDYLSGIFFDISAICIGLSPYILLSLLPFPFRENRYYQLLLEWLYVLLMIPVLLINLIDVAYFGFSGKRSTFELFDIMATGSEMGQLIPQFLADYWFLLVLFLVLVWLLFKTYPKIVLEPYKMNLKRFASEFLLLLFFMGLALIGARGIGLRPLSIVDAAAKTESNKVPLVLNSTFTMIKTFGKQSLVIKDYFPPERVASGVSARIRPTGTAEKAPKKVILVILESFGEEYSALLNPSGAGCMPFTDSLMQMGTRFEHGFANGKRSIEALPAIAAGVPTLMDASIITSSYAANAYQGLPLVMEDLGYESSTFYHGGGNGTMGFESFALSIGYDRYVGMDQYPDASDYDGHWGIFDLPFLQFCAEDILAADGPAFSTIFTLSSHHPYTVPPPYDTLLAKGKNPLEQSIRYADEALRQFMKRLAKSPDYDDYLFVFTADHTPNGEDPKYRNPLGRYKVPIFIFRPNQEAQRLNRMVQQIDIPYLTVAHCLPYGQSGPELASLYSAEEPFAVRFAQGIYQWIEGDLLIQFDGEKTIGCYAWKTDPALKNPLDTQSEGCKKLERKLKMHIQAYNRRMIENDWMP